jgi:hypothetical protein
MLTSPKLGKITKIAEIMKIHKLGANDTTVIDAMANSAFLDTEIWRARAIPSYSRWIASCNWHLSLRSETNMRQIEVDQGWGGGGGLDRHSRRYVLTSC